MTIVIDVVAIITNGKIFKRNNKSRGENDAESFRVNVNFLLLDSPSRKKKEEKRQLKICVQSQFYSPTTHNNKMLTRGKGKMMKRTQPVYVQVFLFFVSFRFCIMFHFFLLRLVILAKVSSTICPAFLIIRSLLANKQDREIVLRCFTPTILLLTSSERVHALFIFFLVSVSRRVSTCLNFFVFPARKKKLKNTLTSL